MNHEFLLFPQPQSTDNVLSYSLKVAAQESGKSLSEVYIEVVNSPDIVESGAFELIRIAFEQILAGAEEGVKAW